MGVHSYDGWNYETEFGNRLTGMWKLDETTGEELRYTFIYDANGRRIKKVTPGGGIYRYYYNGDLLTQMTIGDSYCMFFAYDANVCRLALPATAKPTTMSPTCRAMWWVSWIKTALLLPTIHMMRGAMFFAPIVIPTRMTER